MALLFLLLVLFLLLGLPIAFTIGFPSVLYMLVENPAWLPTVPQRLFSGMDSFVFLAIPFFVAAGEVLHEGRITDRIMGFVDAWVGHVRGGLAQVNVLSSMLFAGISGAALSDVAALGSVFIPTMEKAGYDRRFAAAITATSAIQGPIIPPSIIIIVYAAIMGTSVGALFLAGVVPGVLIGLTDCAIVAWKARQRGYPKREGGFHAGRALRASWAALPALTVPVIIMGGIVFGIVTPTEAAAVALFYALLLGGVFMRSLGLGTLRRIGRSTVVKSAILFTIVAFANVFAWVLAIESVPELVSRYVFGWTDELWLALLVVNLVFLFVGTWLEAGAALILLAPVFGPILIDMGVHPVHLGMIFIVNLVIGLITPPFGIVLYAVASVSGCRVEEIVREALPYVLVDLGVLLLVTFVPSLSLFLPGLFGLL